MQTPYIPPLQYPLGPPFGPFSQLTNYSPRKQIPPAQQPPYPPNYEVSRKDYHQCNSRHFMNIKYTFLFSP